MTDKQPEALRLADELEAPIDGFPEATELESKAAAELRRLHAELETLREKLKTYEDLGDAADDMQLLRMGYAAARLEIESLKSQLHAAKQINAAQFWLLAASIPGSALRASQGQAPAAVAGPVVNRATVIEWLDANDIEVTDRQMDGLFHFAEPTTQPAPQQEAPAAERRYINGVKTVADLVNNLLLLDQSLPIYAAQHIQIANRRRTITVPPTVSRERVKDERWIGEGDELNAAVIWTRAEEAPQPSPAAQGDALSDDAVRVPLDSLHADAAYLIGRLREGSMPYARVIEIIRERIDAAKAAIRARAEQGDALDAARY